jgi:hypothetical protein
MMHEVKRIREEQQKRKADRERRLEELSHAVQEDRQEHLPVTIRPQVHREAGQGVLRDQRLQEKG